MSLISKTYNVHDILRFKIHWKEKRNTLIPRKILNKTNLKFSFFEEQENTSVAPDYDIILNIGKFSPDNSDCYLIDHGYYVKNNYLYVKEKEGRAKWELEIIGIENTPTTINFNIKCPKSISGLLYPDFMAQNILLKILELKLATKGYFLAHAAGIEKNNEAYIFAGRGGSFKTTITMEFIRREQFKYLGDDRIIIRENEVLSFPFNLEIFNFMLQNLKNENSWNIISRLRLINYLTSTSFHKFSFVSSNCPQIKAIIILEKSKYITPNYIDIQEISAEECILKLFFNNRIEDFVDIEFLNITSGPFLRYLLAYYHVFPDNKLFKTLKDEMDILKNTIRKIPCYRALIPSHYTIEIFKTLNEFIKKVD